jgi:hypothetical protein
VQPLPRVAGPLPPAPRPYAASTCHKADSSRDRSPLLVYRLGVSRGDRAPCSSRL